MPKPPRRPATAVTHGGRNRKLSAGAVNVPPYRASTVLFETVAELRRFDPSFQRFRYARQGTPTSRELEALYAELEQAAGAVATCSGLAAAAVAMSAFVAPGDHLLISAGAYEPTVHYARKVLGRMGVDVELFAPREGAAVAARVRPETRVLFLESPSSLTFEVQDVPASITAVREAAGERILTVIHDNTWATGWLHRPLALGADVVVQAASKYVVGHADAMLGLIACNDETLHAVRRHAVLQGVCASPDDCWLGLRGLRTLGVRLARHQQTALALARWLQQRAEVIEVIHPALPGHPDHALFLRDFEGASGLFALRLDPAFDDAAMCRMLDGMEVFGMGFSFGAYESLLIPAVLPAYRQAERETPGILLRLHAGLEDPQDLLADLAAGFERLRG